MKNIILLLLSVCFTTNKLVAQDIQSLFLAMPDSITPLLTDVNKADFIDFKESKMEAKVQNRFFKSSIMKSLSKDYICIEMSENSMWEMKLLPYKDSFVIGVLETVRLPMKDSKLTLYDIDWNQLPTVQFHPSFHLASFTDAKVLADNKITNSELTAIELHSYYYKFNENNNQLIVVFTGLDYLPKELKDRLDKAFNYTLTYSWKEDSFYLSKE